MKKKVIYLMNAELQDSMLGGHNVLRGTVVRDESNFFSFGEWFISLPILVKHNDHKFESTQTIYVVVDNLKEEVHERK